MTWMLSSGLLRLSAAATRCTKRLADSSWHRFGQSAGPILVLVNCSPIVGCGSRSELAFDGAREPEVSAVADGTGGSGAGGSGNATKPSPPNDPRLCVFDYDLTLSSHNCDDTNGQSKYFCRLNDCITYNWYSQCLATGARMAIAECVRRHAYIGIASKSDVDACWSDKVLPILEQQQFPEFTGSAEYGSSLFNIRYPRLEDRGNWNCDECAYTMDGGLSKPDGIRRIMRHYGMNPNLAVDRSRVIFWDDTDSNISDVRLAMPEVRSILVPRFSSDANEGGCGITESEIAQGWAESP